MERAKLNRTELEIIIALLDLKSEIKKSISISEDMKLLASKNNSLSVEWFTGKLTAYENVEVIIENKIQKIKEDAYARQNE